MRAAIACLLLATGCASLGRHAGTISDAQMRGRVADALSTIERLHRDGWLDRIARSECVRTFDRVPASEVIDGLESDDVIGELGAGPPETTPSDCRAALDGLVAVSELHDELSYEARHEPLEALRRGIRELRPVADECPIDDPGTLGAMTAVAREIGEATAGGPYVIAPAPRECAIPTLGASLRLAPRPVDARGTQIDAVCRGAPEGGSCEGSVRWPPEAGLVRLMDASSAYVEVMHAGQHALDFEGFVVSYTPQGWRVIARAHLGQACL